MSWDPYLDLRTGVLHNRLGITDAGELAQVEADISSFRIAQLWRHPLPGDYDLTHLRGFHRHIFGDLWDWAGELRTVRLGKGGAPFCQPERLTTTAAELFARHSVDELRATDRVGFLDKLVEPDVPHICRVISRPFRVSLRRRGMLAGIGPRVR